MTNKTELTDEQKAEAIAEWLGFEPAPCDDKCGQFWFHIDYPSLDLDIIDCYKASIDPMTNWLASDAGTVAMIEKLRSVEGSPPPLKNWEALTLVLFKPDLNAALQAAIWEVIKHG